MYYVYGALVHWSVGAALGARGHCSAGAVELPWVHDVRGALERCCAGAVGTHLHDIVCHQCLRHSLPH